MSDEIGIPVSDFPDWLKEKTDQMCPICKKGVLISWHEADGPDDFIRVWECPECNERFDE